MAQAKVDSEKAVKKSKRISILGGRISASVYFRHLWVRHVFSRPVVFKNGLFKSSYEGILP